MARPRRRGRRHRRPRVCGIRPRDYSRLFARARAFGLGITVHTGESGPVEEVAEVVELLEPDRIGHGVKAAYDPRTMAMIRERGIVLEALPDLEHQHARRVGLGRVPLDLRHAPPQRDPVHDQHRRPGDAQDLHPRRARDAGQARDPHRSPSRRRLSGRLSRHRSCPTWATSGCRTWSRRPARRSSGKRPSRAPVG